MRIRLIFLVMTAFFLSAPSINAASDPGGFLGLKWSQSPAECKKLELCSNGTIMPEDKLVSESVWKGKSTNIDGVNLRFSSFAFNNSKYYMGIAAFDSSSSSFDALKKALIAKYGKPTAETPMVSSWTVGKTRILLSNEKSTGALMYVNIPLFNEVAKAKKYPPYKQPTKNSKP
jgi:hypothetical protein